MYLAALVTLLIVLHTIEANSDDINVTSSTTAVNIAESLTVSVKDSGNAPIFMTIDLQENITTSNLPENEGNSTGKSSSDESSSPLSLNLFDKVTSTNMTVEANKGMNTAKKLRGAGKSNDCRHMRLNIHIGQFVINETIVNTPLPEITKDSDKQNSLNMGSSYRNKHKYEYEILKVPLEHKPRANLGADLLDNKILSLMAPDRKLARVNHNVNRKILHDKNISCDRGDSVNMIDNIVKDIVKKYKNEYNWEKSSRITLDESPYIQSRQDSNKLNCNVNRFMSQNPQINPTLSPHDKEQIKQEIIERVMKKLNGKRYGNQLKRKRRSSGHEVLTIEILPDR